MMLSRLSKLTPAIVILSTTLALSGCGYNDFFNAWMNRPNPPGQRY